MKVVNASLRCELSVKVIFLCFTLNSAFAKVVSLQSGNRGHLNESVQEKMRIREAVSENKRYKAGKTGQNCSHRRYVQGGFSREGERTGRCLHKKKEKCQNFEG